MSIPVQNRPRRYLHSRPLTNDERLFERATTTAHIEADRRFQRALWTAMAQARKASG